MRRSHEVLRANPSLSGASTPIAAGTRTRIALFAVVLALSVTAAMVFAGRAFDAITAPSQARVAAQTLPNSTVVDIPGVGHDAVDKSRCAQRVLASFLSAPDAPDTSCVARVRPQVFR